MARANIAFQREETIYGRHIRSREWIEYKAKIIIRESGEEAVSIDLEFQGIQPLSFEMPLKKKIKAENVSKAFVKLLRFFRSYEIKMV